MERILKYLMLMLIATLSLTFTACGSDDDEPNNSGKTIDLTDTRLKLISFTGTACEVFEETPPFKELVFHSDGSVTEISFKPDTYITGTYTVSGNKVTFSGLSRWSTIWGSTFYFSSSESWDGKEIITFVSTLTSYTSAAAGFDCYVSRLNNGNSGGNSGGGNSGGGNSSGGNSSGGNHGGGSSSYEVPDISYYDVTLGTNSLEVSYRIWNKDKCGSLSNARIYYGTSSANKSVRATVSGVYIKAKITGLSKGTEYQVKCSVTGSGGSTATEETTLSTLY